MREIKLYKSKWKNFGLLIGSSLFVSVGLYFITSDDSDTFKMIIGWVSILFFGLGIPISLYNIFDWRPQIIINEVGIIDRTIIKDFINWNVIENAYLVNTGAKFICITLKLEIDIKKSQSKFSKRVSSFNKTFGFQELNINLASIKINEERLTQFILEMSKANPSDRGQLLLNWY